MNELKKIRETTGLSRLQIAQIVKSSIKDIERWENNKKINSAYLEQLNRISNNAQWYKPIYKHINDVTSKIRYAAKLALRQFGTTVSVVFYDDEKSEIITDAEVKHNSYVVCTFCFAENDIINKCHKTVNDIRQMCFVEDINILSDNLTEFLSEMKEDYPEEYKNFITWCTSEYFHSHINPQEIIRNSFLQQ